MKKKLLFLFLLLIPFIVNAEKCSVVSGTGTNIGDEINCSGEHFYVISNDGYNVKALAKYNLYVGQTYFSSEEFTHTTQIFQQLDAIEYMENYCHTEYGEDYYIYWSRTTNAPYVYTFTCNNKIDLEYDSVKQNELAVGAHGSESGKPEFPEVGIIIFDENYPFADTERVYGNDNYADAKILTTNNSPIGSYLEEYKTELSKMGYNIKDINILSLTDIDNIVKETTGSNLPLDTWYTNANSIHTEKGNIKVFGSLKEILNGKNAWLYSTTYWLRTYDVNFDDDIFFVDTLGDVCSANYCSSRIGAGIRPIITLEFNDIDYPILTKTDGNGTIKIEKIKAQSGEMVRFTVEPKPGYVLGTVKVTDANGNVITFTDYTFVMPSSQVIIEATFVPINPKTEAGKRVIIAIILCLISIVLLIGYFKNEKQIEEV